MDDHTEAAEAAETERRRLERLTRRVRSDMEYAEAANLSQGMRDRMAAQHQRLTEKLGYDPGPVE